jgi:Protein of unknown function (DUF4231)
MDSAQFGQYLDERYFPEVKWYDRRASWNRRLYIAFQAPLIVFSAITPVLIAAGGDFERWLAVLISAAVAISASTLKAGKFEENWLNYRSTCETLRKEVHYLRAQVGAYKNASNPEGTFVERVESLISRENALWVSSRAPEEGETGTRLGQPA